MVFLQLQLLHCTAVWMHATSTAQLQAVHTCRKLPELKMCRLKRRKSTTRWPRPTSLDDCLQLCDNCATCLLYQHWCWLCLPGRPGNSDVPGVM